MHVSNLQQHRPRKKLQYEQQYSRQKYKYVVGMAKWLYPLTFFQRIVGSKPPSDLTHKVEGKSFLCNSKQKADELW